MAQGFAIWTDPDAPIQALVREADLAMYHCKRYGLGGAVLYDVSIETNNRENAIVEEALRAALANGGEFSIKYQPIVDAQTGAMVKAEALARWTSRSIGEVPPEKFIAVAERTGLIIPIGVRLFELVCDDLGAFPDLRVSINISPLQLQQPDFIPSVIETLDRRKIDLSRIEIELTEGVIVENPEVSAFRLDLLREAGFSTSLDDFGTGYSSLGYLKKMPFNTLKIDRSFVTSFAEGDNSLDLVRAMVVLGQSLGQKVVTEGVETAEQARILAGIGCDYLQGFYFSRPLVSRVLAERWLEPAAKAG